MLGSTVGRVARTVAIVGALAGVAIGTPAAGAHGVGSAPDDPLQWLDGTFPGFAAVGSPDAISCVDAGRRFEVVYARPVDQPSRFDDVRPALVRAVYDASAIWDLEARRQRPGRRARLRVLCHEAGVVPVVREVPLRTTSTRDSAGSVLFDLKRAGLNDALTKYLVFFDGCVPISKRDARCHTGGVATIRYDERPSIENLNNFGPSWAVDFAGADGSVSALTLAHEAGHVMGAVQRGAPFSDGVGHCTDALDLMCVTPAACTVAPDRVPEAVLCVADAAQTLRCPSRQVDCGDDTYFDARRDPQGYLGSHWNIAARYNEFLDHGPLPD